MVLRSYSAAGYSEINNLAVYNAAHDWAISSNKATKYSMDGIKSKAAISFYIVKQFVIYFYAVILFENIAHNWCLYATNSKYIQNVSSTIKFLGRF